jgi:hypothetical protein
MKVFNQSIFPTPPVEPSLIPVHHIAKEFPSFLLSGSKAPMSLKFIQSSLPKNYPHNSKYAISFPTTHQMN